jgi:hypothetical protein
VYLSSPVGISRGAGAPYQEFGGSQVRLIPACRGPLVQLPLVNHPSQQKAQDGFGLSAVSPPCTAKVIESNSDAASNEITNTNAQVNYDSGVGVDNPVCGGCPVRRTK